MNSNKIRHSTLPEKKIGIIKMSISVMLRINNDFNCNLKKFLHLIIVGFFFYEILCYDSSHVQIFATFTFLMMDNIVYYSNISTSIVLKFLLRYCSTCRCLNCSK